MAVVPETITVTIDGDALREKIQGILQEEKANLARDFRFMASVLDPAGEAFMLEAMRTQVRRELVKEFGITEEEEKEH